MSRGLKKMKTSFKVRFPASTLTGPRREGLGETWGMGMAISSCRSLRAWAARSVNPVLSVSPGWIRGGG